LQPHPEGVYLLKGLIAALTADSRCGAQTNANGNRYYREQKGSRGTGHCVGLSGSMRCEVPDGQRGRIILIASWVTKAERKPQEDHPAAHGLEFQEVQFASRQEDAVSSGWYIPGQGLKPTLIFVHGIASVCSVNKAVDLASRLVSQGLSVLSFDLLTVALTSKFHPHSNSPPQGGEKRSLPPPGGRLGWG
jgi:hypothetical protein